MAVFSTVSALSTTGFSTVDYSRWNGLGWLVLILLMLVGGSTGSTAGGIKQYRIHVLFRGLVWEFRRALLPRRAVTQPDIWRSEGRQFISDSHLRRVELFVALYGLAFGPLLRRTRSGSGGRGGSNGSATAPATAADLPSADGRLPE